MEAASIDGCGPVHRFVHITIPFMRPIILVVLLVRIMDAFRVYDTVYIITQAGPADQTDVLSYYAYRQMFTNGAVGTGAAASMIALLVVMVIGTVLIIGLRRESLS
jgi:multiple sugar transport system permease protein